MSIASIFYSSVRLILEQSLGRRTHSEPTTLLGLLKHTQGLVHLPRNTARRVSALALAAV